MTQTLQYEQSSTFEPTAVSPRTEFEQIFLHNPDYSVPAQVILEATDKRVAFAESYITLFPRLLEASQSFSSVFPGDTATGVAAGNRNLISGALYAAAYHIEHENSTDATIELRSGKALAVEYYGSQPVEALTSLGRSMRRIGTVVNNPIVPIVRAVETADFRIYRFVDQDHPGQPAVHAYVRPAGGTSYDPTYEYGRPGSGVEASLSLIVDNRSGEALAHKPFLGEITKKHYGPRPDNRISLRLDREGVRPEDREILDSYHHPELPDGTLAYDAGSVLGAATGGTMPLGTRVGRLLAWGNALASQATGRHIGLNHTTEGFGNQLGQSTHFARHADLFEASLQDRLIRPDDVRRVLGWIPLISMELK